MNKIFSLLNYKNNKQEGFSYNSFKKEVDLKILVERKNTKKFINDIIKNIDNVSHQNSKLIQYRANLNLRNNLNNNREKFKNELNFITKKDFNKKNENNKKCPTNESLLSDIFSAKHNNVHSYMDEDQLILRLNKNKHKNINKKIKFKVITI